MSSPLALGPSAPRGQWGVESGREVTLGTWLSGSNSLSILCTVLNDQCWMCLIWYDWFYANTLFSRDILNYLFILSIISSSHLWLWQDNFTCLKSDNHLASRALSRDYFFKQVAHLPELKREFLKQVLKELILFFTQNSTLQLNTRLESWCVAEILLCNIDSCHLPYTRLRAHAQGPVNSNSGRHLVVLHPHHHFLIYSQFGCLSHCGEDGVAHRLSRWPGQAN